LQKVNALRGPKLFAVIAIVAITTIWAFSTLINSVFLAPPPKPIIAPVPVRKIEKKAPPPEPKPWENIDDPKDVMLKCFEATQNVVSISTPGWKIDGITCTPTGLVTSWHREIGRIALIDEALNKSSVTFLNKAIAPSGDSVMVTVPISDV
jgi:hypothetical protein